MEVNISAADRSRLLGADFSTDRLESVAGAVLELPPENASQIAQLFFERHASQAPVVLAMLFSVGDLETAHRIVLDAKIAWEAPLQSNILALIVSDLAQPGLLPCGEQRSPDKRALALYDRYIQEREGAFHRDSVVLPPDFESEKFMLMEVKGTLYLRVGGRFHRDIMQATVSEFSECGAKKSAARIASRGGGLLESYDGRLFVYGDSTEFGKADMQQARQLIAAARPEAEVAIY